jgi:hypothetical protein
MSTWQLLAAYLRECLHAVAPRIAGSRRRRALEKRRLERFMHERAGLSRARAAQLAGEFIDGQQ